MPKIHNHNSTPQLDWISGQPFSTKFEDVYFSKEHGLNESRYVFIDKNNLPHRFAQLKKGQAFTIAETGFGTGLNFLACYQEWLKSSPDECYLHYISVEKYPLNISQLRQALALWPELKPQADLLLAYYPSPITQKVVRIVLAEARIHLTLIFDDVQTALEELDPNAYETTIEAATGSRPMKVNAWFLDGFAPSKNPDMWQPRLYRAMANLGAKNCTLATFTAAGDVRRGLTAAGFTISKTQGFGRKRDMVVGSLEHTPQPAAPGNEETNNHGRSRQNPGKTYWHLQSATPPLEAPIKEHKIAIIGAGLAGCHTARVLASKGYKVDIYDSHACAAQGASGNPQGVIYTRFSHQGDALAQFNIAALNYADALYRSQYSTCGDLCGVRHVAQTDKQAYAQQKIAEHYSCNPELIRSQASEDFNTALYTPLGGWMQPKMLCERLLNHPAITFYGDHHLIGLSRKDSRWHLAFSHQDANPEISSHHYQTIVLCNAYAAKKLALLSTLPTKAIRGQMTSGRLAAEGCNTLPNIKSPICGDGYVAPALTQGDKQTLSFGATFDLNSQSPCISESDNQLNLEKLHALLPHWQGEFLSLSGRTSFRCSTADYMPIVGPGFSQENQQRFEAYRKNKYSEIRRSGITHDGLYLNIGHGSRGLAYTPICAEVVGSLISGEALPLSQKLYRHLHPGRFLIRKLMRSN